MEVRSGQVRLVGGQARECWQPEGGRKEMTPRRDRKAQSGSVKLKRLIIHHIILILHM